MSPLHVLLVAGCRPNFVKLAPLWRAMERRKELQPFVVNTGQHYDEGLAGVFFRDLGLPPPDVSLDVGSGSHASQTARVMERIEPVLQREQPDVVVVVGDVNSTVAAATTAVKLGMPVAHVEAGLRSFDREMPEEVNRVLTDAISDLLFVTEESAVANLRREGIPDDRVWFVGNVMADALLASRERIALSTAVARLELQRGRYVVATLHRPENVDDPQQVERVAKLLRDVADDVPVVLPLHPRTRARLAAAGLLEALLGNPRLRITEPLGYLDFLKLVTDAGVVVTDSGGLQEESTVLGVPCLTLRPNTERPATVLEGSNRIVGTEPAAVVEAVRACLAGPRPPARVPRLWDGAAAERVADVLVDRTPHIRSLYPRLRARTRAA